MKIFYALAALQALRTAQALPADPAPTGLTGPFTLSAALSGKNNINRLKVEASGFGYNLGSVGPATYCPSFVSSCPPGNETVLGGAFSPIVNVPGGQQGYVAPNGRIQYTQAHSLAYPPGSYFGGWSWTAGAQTVTNCNPDDLRYNCDAGTGIAVFKAPELETSGIYACPVDQPDHRTYYNLYALTPGFNQTGCTKLDGLITHTYTGPNPNAWQYT